MVSTEVIPLRREQLNQATAAVAAAFRDDPVYASLLPDPKRRPDALRAFMRMPLSDAIPFGSAYAAVAGAEVIDAAAWLPPGGYPWSGRRKLRSSVGMLKVARHARGALRDLAALGAATERAFPTDPVWYLEVVGIRPDRQGGGAGAALLAPGLAAADAVVEPCYLETASARNVAFYERLGFRVERADVRLAPRGPTHWTMRREPG